MTTALGEFVVVMGGEARGDAAAPRGAPAASGPWRTLATAPWIRVSLSGDFRHAVAGSRAAIALVREPERGGAAATPAQAADAALARWLGEPGWSPRTLRGRFVLIGWDEADRSVTVFSDAFRTYPVYHARTRTGFACASDLRLVVGARGEPPRIDRDAIFHYLNFAYVPSPWSAVAGVSKLPPGARLAADAAGDRVTREWDPGYPEDLAGTDDALADELRDRIVANVRDWRPGPGTTWGTFLSGGTDSSSISGILARAHAPARVSSFSIGFREDEYDEMSFSRLAAERFGLDGHEQMVGEADAVAAIPAMVAAFDEPFGNPSAIPTYCCARLARDAGLSLLVAGDGGDEIFGGNERYAKDQVYGWYHRSPAPVRVAARLLARGLSRFDSLPANRLRNIIRRGEMPNPDRFYSDDSFASDRFDDLLSPDFRDGIARDASLEIQREHFRRARTGSELHRLMYLDLQMTIAESDLVKVLRAARAAGVDVAFPYIDRELVDYTGRLPARHKVRGLEKRFLFKRAMREVLPVEIRRKKKQGFGLPMPVWLRRGGPMRDLVRDVVLSPRALGRGVVEAAAVRDLVATHERGTWDNASEIYRLFMLELWQRECIDGRG